MANKSVKPYILIFSNSIHFEDTSKNKVKSDLLPNRDEGPEECLYVLNIRGNLWGLFLLFLFLVILSVETE